MNSKKLLHFGGLKRPAKLVHLHLLYMGWRNFFPSVLLCQSLVLVGNRLWFYILMYLKYNTVVVLCQFFGSGGKQFLVLRMTLVYNTVVQLCQFFGIGRKQISKCDHFSKKKSYWVTFSMTAYLFLVLYKTTSLQSRPLCGSQNQ